MSLPVSLLPVGLEVVAMLAAFFGLSVSVAKLRTDKEALKFLEDLISKDPELKALFAESYEDFEIDDLEMALIKNKIEASIGSKFTLKFSLWGNKYTAAIKIVRDAVGTEDSEFFEELAEKIIKPKEIAEIKKILLPSSK